MSAEDIRDSVNKSAPKSSDIMEFHVSEIKTFLDLDMWGEPRRYTPRPIDKESEGEEIDALSSDTMNGNELDRAHGGKQ